MGQRVSVQLITDRKVALELRRFEVADSRPDVVLAATGQAIDEPQALRLRDFVGRGGGLVVVGGTLAAWAGSAPIRDVAGWVPGGRGPTTELIVRPESSHPITQRLDSEWKVQDELYLSEGPPAGATILLRTSWRYTEQVVAYERRFGDGRFLYIGLSGDGSQSFEKLLSRSLLFAAGRATGAPAGVGLLGYGAIGRDHAASISATPGLHLAGVCDLSLERRDAAAREWSVRTHELADERFADPNVDLGVVGTPPSAHTEPVLAALEAGTPAGRQKPARAPAAGGGRRINSDESPLLVLT